MTFEDKRQELKDAVAKMDKHKLNVNSEAPQIGTRRQARSYTLRPDVVNAINIEADKQHVSASHLVEQILTDYFEL